MASGGNKDVTNEPLSMEQSSISGAKRKRGRPRKYEYPVELPQRAQSIQSVLPLHCSQDGTSIQQDGLQASHTSSDSAHGNRISQSRNSANLVNTSDNQVSYYSNAPLQVNSGNDDILGKHFVGKLTKNFPGFSLVTVKVKGNQVLRGWIPDENNLHPITPKDDLAPEVPMFQPSQVRKQAPAMHLQASPPVPIHLEDVTLAKPLQMRRPVEKTIAKHTIPLAPIPYLDSGVTAVPVSVSSSNTETRTVAKKDTELVTQQPVVTAVPINSARPLLVLCKKGANQNELVGDKSVNECQKDPEPSNGTKESSGQTQHADTTVIDEIEIASGVGDQPNSANSEHQGSKEPSDSTEQSGHLKTETDVLKGVDGLNSGASDGVHSTHDEHELKVDNK